MRGRVLVVAGSDSSGGAGIQADIKTVMALGGYATTAITALTAQDTNGVHAVMPVPAAFVLQQMRLALADIGADCIKTGMLGDAALIEAVADLLDAQKNIPLVVDPVMVAKGGHALLPDAAIAAVKRRLLPLAAVLTPNVPEAEALTGLRIHTPADMRAAAAALLALGPRAVLMKGGHLEGGTVTDMLVESSGTETVFAGPRLASRHTHGTGCTLASGVATLLARGFGLEESVRKARAYVVAAIAAAPGFGAGHGPLGHGVNDSKGVWL